MAGKSLKSLNKVQLIGNLGKDAELRYTGGGQPVATFSLATNERYQKDGEWQDRTEWHNLVLWGKTAESLAQYLVKGTKIYAEGRLQTRSWDDKTGQKRYTTEIVVRDVILLGLRAEQANQHTTMPAPPMTGQQAESAGAFDDNSPF